MYQTGHCLQHTLSVRLISWSPRDGLTISQPCLDNPTHSCIGELCSSSLALMKWLFNIFPTSVKGLCSVVCPTAYLIYFRTPSELDRYLEASQIRERAIERINSVTGTYGLVFVIISSTETWLLVYIYNLCRRLHSCMINN